MLPMAIQTAHMDTRFFACSDPLMQLDISTIDLAAIFAASLAFVNGAVALMKSPALRDFWRDILPWWGKLVFFALVALVSAILQALVSGAHPVVAAFLGLGAVGSAVLGHEGQRMIQEAIAERREEKVAQAKADG